MHESATDSMSHLALCCPSHPKSVRVNSKKLRAERFQGAKDFPSESTINMNKARSYLRDLTRSLYLDAKADRLSDGIDKR